MTGPPAEAGAGAALPEPRPLDLVAVGASAGGVEALRELLSALPASPPFAVAVVLHVAEDAPAALAEVLGRACAAPVSDAVDKAPVRPGAVWLAPPGYHLLVEREGTFALSVDDPVHHARPSVDVLFEAVADAYGPRAAGIVLSGANEDGAEGLARIARAGGIALVQAPGTAAFPAMPAAALRRAAATPLTLGALSRYLGLLAAQRATP